jgi:hypothetical protein
MNTALEYSTKVVQEGGRRCKKSTLNDLVHLTPLRIPLMNPPLGFGLSIVPVWKMTPAMAAGFRTSPPGYMGWRGGAPNPLP